MTMTMRIRRLLVEQSLLLLMGAVLIFACQASASSANGFDANARTGFSSDLFQGACIIGAVVAFAWAGRVRSRINDLVRRLDRVETERDSSGRRIEAA